MNRRLIAITLVVVLSCAALTSAIASRRKVVNSVQIGGHTVVVREASELSLPPVPGSPVGFDCNSPLFWNNGTLYSFTSHEHPFRSSGSDLRRLAQTPIPVRFVDDDGPPAGGRWIEAVYKAGNGRVYMWYHQEPKPIVAGRPEMTAPRIGQMYSEDDGLNWHDQGIILEADRSTFNLESSNRYFVGGFGDFSVIADEASGFLYFFISTYHRDPAQQGVAIARLPLFELDYPTGQIRFWEGSGWNHSGPRDTIHPIFPAEVDWHAWNAKVFWGPSIHYNTYLKAYVLVMNKSTDSGFGQGGVYISTNPRLDDPKGWTTPVKLLDASEWYPQVVGTGPNGTDRLADGVARLFLKGKSRWELVFY